jgi:hypothetical protein
MTPSPCANCSSVQRRIASSVPALRRIERFIDERLPPLAEVALAAAAFNEIRDGRGVGLETLRRLLRRG